MTRREFAGAAAFTIVPRHVLGRGQTAPSDKITVASIGMGRQGLVVTMSLLAKPDVRVVAVCDCNQSSKDYAEYGNNDLLRDARRAIGDANWGQDLASPGRANLTHIFSTSLGMGGREPAKRIVDACYKTQVCTAYSDYRELLEKEKDLDAVYVATPDHWHAPISMAAMRKRKHVLCQKPMTHTIGEARRMAALAAETKVATSLPVNNVSSASTALIKQWIDDGAIGKVSEVHNWSSRPFWPQGVERPAASMPVPAGLDWNMWLGPAPERPYNKAYLPFVWRGWFDFGCGSFGDMGCYSFAGIFKILGLAPPVAVEACASEPHSETYPLASVVHMDFPSGVHLAWYDGGLMPKRPAGLGAESRELFQPRAEGIMYVGDKGLIVAGFNGNNPRLYPESKKYVAPERRNAPGDGAVEEWIAACKGGPAASTNFPSQSPVTEAFLLGCLTQRLPNERFEWDTAAMKITNSAEANKFIDPPYRGSWT